MTGSAPGLLVRRLWIGWAPLLLGLLMMAIPAGAATVRDISFVPQGKGGTLTLRLDAPVARVSTLALASPDRFVIDVSDAYIAGRSNDAGGVISRIRGAQFNAGTARLVLDLGDPVTLTDLSFAEGGRQIVIKLNAIDAAAFAREIRAGRRTYSDGQEAANKAEDEPKEKAQKPADPPASMPAASTTRGHRPLVVIDAGHGGHDTGALSIFEGRREKDVTLAIAKAIAAELNESGKVRATLTRDDDRFLILGDRVQVARRQKADLFISIHADSAANPEARGATVYTLSEVASDREAARLAAKENKSDIVNGVDFSRETKDVSSILIDLARRQTMNVSSAFAALLQRELVPYVRFKTGFHRFAGFAVLKAADTPAILLETGYLSNMDDAKFLFSRRGQKNIAVGVRKAVEAHFARYSSD